MIKPVIFFKKNVIGYTVNDDEADRICNLYKSMTWKYDDIENLSKINSKSDFSDCWSLSDYGFNPHDSFENRTKKFLDMIIDDRSYPSIINKIQEFYNIYKDSPYFMNRQTEDIWFIKKMAQTQVIFE